MARQRIVLLTSTYPWGPGEEFLTPELPHWERDDVELTIMPWRETTMLRDLPSYVRVDRRLNDLRKTRWRGALARQATQLGCWREAAASIAAKRLHPRALWHIAVTSAAADLTAAALKSFADEHGQVTLAYSYWFDYQTLGALRARKAVKHVASRAHRYDLYEEASPDQRLPFRRWMAPQLDLLAPISSDGLQYVRSRFGALERSSHSYRLGVPIHDGLGRLPHNPAHIRLLTVSSLTAVKRVDLMLEVVSQLGGLHPQARIDWVHAGSGPLLDQLRSASGTLPSNIQVRWLGQLDRGALEALYSETPWNLIVNLSSSEGVPVSLMEAMERGVPVAATNVGATEELVRPPGGLLLESTATTQEWASAISTLLPQTLEPEWREQFRLEIIRHWDEDKNMEHFVNSMVAIDTE